MGVYYSYVNWDLAEYFSIGVGGFATKLSGLGYTPAARALGLLLMNPAGLRQPADPAEGQLIVGRWYRSRVSLEPDESDDDSWDTIREDFTDVEADVVVMLCLFDDAASIAELCARDPFFLQVAHLVVTRQLPDGVRRRLERVLGDGYQARYAELAKERPHSLRAVQLRETLGWFS